MKMTHWMLMVMSLAIGLDALVVGAQENTTRLTAPTQKNAVVAKDRVNMRGKASLKSEVVAQLGQGEPVTILEEIKVSETEGKEPEKWYRIALPESVPVWVHANFINPEALTVKANRLNMRTGPGENFSVLGQMNQGESITVIETKGDWIKIKAPDQAYAYVAAYLVTVQDATETPAEKPVVVKTTPTTPIVSAPVTAKSEVTESPEPESVPLIVEELPPGSEIGQPVDPDNAIPSILTEPLVVEVDTNTISNLELVLAGEPSVESEEETSDMEPEAEPEVPKRIVYREGIVRRSTSIQAPTYYILANPYNGRTINYLHSPSNQVVLQDYYGARVLVKGEEMLDERWLKTPVITIETLETVP